jgi:hypothetical protein
MGEMRFSKSGGKETGSSVKISLNLATAKFLISVLFMIQSPKSVLIASILFLFCQIIVDKWKNFELPE